MRVATDKMNAIKMKMVRRANVKRPDDGNKIEKNVKENDNPAANIKLYNILVYMYDKEF